MKVNYCDLCACPLKENDYYILYICKSSDSPKLIQNEMDYYQYLQKVQKEIKEICPQCKLIIDEIFKLRFQNLSKLSLELLGIYSEPSKDDPHDKRKK